MIRIQIDSVVGAGKQINAAVTADDGTLLMQLRGPVEVVTAALVEYLRELGRRNG